MYYNKIVNIKVLNRLREMEFFNDELVENDTIDRLTKEKLNTTESKTVKLKIIQAFAPTRNSPFKCVRLTSTAKP